MQQPPDLKVPLSASADISKLFLALIFESLDLVIHGLAAKSFAVWHSAQHFSAAICNPGALCLWSAESLCDFHLPVCQLLSSQAVSTLNLLHATFS